MRARRPPPGMGEEKFWLLFGGIWSVVGIPFLLFGVITLWHAYRIDNRLDREGITVQGVVLAKEVRQTDDSSDSYLVEFRFQRPDHALQTRQIALQQEAWERYQEQDLIPITFLPGDPGTLRVPGQATDNLLGLIFIGVGGGFGSAGVAIVGYALRRWLRRRRLVNEGIPVKGEVTAVHDAHIAINDEPMWKIRYAYTDRAGRQHTGESGLLPHAAAREWQAGDPCGCLYDPHRPEVSLFLGEPP